MVDSITYFISYSRADEQFALELAKKLRTSGANVWIDQIDIQAGERWDRAIEDALEASDGLLILLSRTSVESDNVMDEVSYALEEKKDVIPILVEDCEIPFRLRRLQYIDLSRNDDKSFGRLLQAIKLEEQSSQAVSYESSVPAPKAYRNQPNSRQTWFIAGISGAVVISSLFALRSILPAPPQGGDNTVIPSESDRSPESDPLPPSEPETDGDLASDSDLRGQVEQLQSFEIEIFYKGDSSNAESYRSEANVIQSKLREVGLSNVSIGGAWSADVSDYQIRYERDTEEEIAKVLKDVLGEIYQEESFRLQTIRGQTPDYISIFLGP